MSDLAVFTTPAMATFFAVRSAVSSNTRLSVPTEFIEVKLSTIVSNTNAAEAVMSFAPIVHLCMVFDLLPNLRARHSKEHTSHPGRWDRHLPAKALLHDPGGLRSRG